MRVRHPVTSLTHELQRPDLAASHDTRRPRRDLALAHDLITWRDVDGDEHARVGRVGSVVADTLKTIRDNASNLFERASPTELKCPSLGYIYICYIK